MAGRYLGWGWIIFLAPASSFCPLAGCRSRTTLRPPSKKEDIAKPLSEALDNGDEDRRRTRAQLILLFCYRHYRRQTPYLGACSGIKPGDKRTAPKGLSMGTASGLVIPAERQHKARIVQNGVLPAAAMAAEQHTIPAAQWVLSTPGAEMHPEIRLPVPGSWGQPGGR